MKPISERIRDLQNDLMQRTGKDADYILMGVKEYVLLKWESYNRPMVYSDMKDIKEFEGLSIVLVKKQKPYLELGFNSKNWTGW